MNGPGLTLTGYGYSVYTRSVRMALAAAGVGYEYTERDPFDPADTPMLQKVHPFGRVPVLEQGGFRLYETAAILHYVAEALGAPLVPETAQARARMRQVMGVADAYVYWPLVRQAVSHGIFRAAEGEAGDRDVLKAGLEAAPRVLDALEEIAAEGLVLRPGAPTLACCQLWPMLDYFAMLPEGRALMRQRPALWAWAGAMAMQDIARATRPDLSYLQGDTT